MTPRRPQAFGSSSDAVSTLRMGRRCWSIRRTEPPTVGFAGFCRSVRGGLVRELAGSAGTMWPRGGEGQIVVFVPRWIDDGLAGRLRRLKSDFGDRAYLALTRRFRPNDALRLYRLEETARAARVPTVATNDVLYHGPERRMLQDVVTCIREAKRAERIRLGQALQSGNRH